MKHILFGKKELFHETYLLKPQPSADVPYIYFIFQQIAKILAQCVQF